MASGKSAGCRERRRQAAVAAGGGDSSYRGVSGPLLPVSFPSANAERLTCTQRCLRGAGSSIGVVKPTRGCGGPPLLQQNQLCTRTVYALQTGFPGQLQHGAPSAKGCRPHRASLPLLPTIDPTNMYHQLIRALEEACSGYSHLVHTSNAAGELAVAAGHLHEIAANPSRPRVAQQEGTAAAR